MKYRKLVDGDYSFGSGNNDFVYDNAAMVQAIKTSLLLLKGEWWEDIEKGLPLFESILGQPGTPENLRAIDLIIQDNIASVNGVLNIKDYTGTYTASREYMIECKVDTIYGEAYLKLAL